MLHPIKPLSDNAEFVAAFANTVSRNADKVCGVCGLGVMGHAPESAWLGFERHQFAPVAATPVMVERARVLTREAYAARVSEPCGHHFKSYKCNTKNSPALQA